MDMKLCSPAALLAAPAIAPQHLPEQFLIRILFELKARLLGR
jgi:hypothetical protein